MNIDLNNYQQIINYLIHFYCPLMALLWNYFDYFLIFDYLFLHFLILIFQFLILMILFLLVNSELFDFLIHFLFYNFPKYLFFFLNLDFLFVNFEFFHLMYHLIFLFHSIVFLIFHYFPYFELRHQLGHQIFLPFSMNE